MRIQIAHVVVLMMTVLVISEGLGFNYFPVKPRDLDDNKPFSF